MNEDVQLKAIYIAIIVIAIAIIIWLDFRQQKRKKQIARYVLGFCYHTHKAMGAEITFVALILKNKPEWQQGKLNGVGGKIEQGEHPRQSMTREFREETGVEINPKAWSYFACIKGSNFEVHCFSILDEEAYKNAKTTTDEKVIKQPIEWVLHSQNVIPNLKFIIPMGYEALYDPNFSLITQQQQLHLMNLD